MLWFRKRKHIERQIQEQKAAAVESDKRALKAVGQADQQINKLHQRLVANGITFRIHIAMGGKHGH